MITRLPVAILGFAALFAGAFPVFGQSLQVSVAVGGQSTPVTSGGTAALTAADVGQAVRATVTVRYNGTATASVTGVSVNGTSEMTLLSSPTFPVVLNPGASTSFTVQYLPSSGNSVAAAVSIAFTESGQAGSFPFTLTGTSPRLSFSYFFAPNGTLTDLNAGDRITFPATNVGASAQAVVTILNRGSGPGSVQSITVAGSTFQLSGASAPTQLKPGEQATFTVTYTPQSTGGSQGLLSVVLGSGSTETFSLIGTGTSANFAVSYTLSDGNVRPLSSGSLINFPSVDVNASTTATITILNQGTGAGTVTGISVSGAGFQLSGLPLLPATVSAGQNIQFRIIFTPTQAGSFNGSFSIALGGSVISGTLSGSTSAPNLSASYTIGNSTSTSLSSGSVITFPAVDVNATSTATVTILNQGAGTGTINSISVSGTGFQISGAPPLPATIPAGQRITFGIVFAPTQAGSSNGTFSINLNGNSIFGSLSGSTTTPNFSVSYTLSNLSVLPIVNGGTITFPSVDINTPATANITILNQGTGTGTVTGIFVTGAAYQLTGLPLLPATVPAGQSLKFGITFTATQPGTYTGSFRIDMTGATISGNLTETTSSSTIALSYVDPDTTNIVPLPAGATLQFPSTLSGTSNVITVLATNTGSGTGMINSITLGGSGSSVFQLLGLQAFPLSVPPNQQARFGVRFSPQQQQAFTASLTVDVNGQSVTITLAGQGTGAQYTYSSTSAGSTTPLLPDGTLAVPDTAIGQTSSVTVSITNNGSGDGQISNVAVTGTGFSLSGLPSGPITLHANGSQQFTLNFTPVDPGAAKGRLTIGSDNFNLTGTGLGSKLLYTYTDAAGTNPVAAGGTIIYAPTAVGTTSSVKFTIQNTGTSATTISSINLGTTTSLFALQGLPALPLSLSPDATVSVTVNFLPSNTGPSTATLLVNSTAFTLSGTGNPPAPLPPYQFQGPTGNQQPAQQASIGLSLTSPYALPLRGTLTLSFTSTVFTDDPAIQFANGGRTINFTIPANSTQALFNGNTTVPLQTGTTAGNIVITPSFAMQSGFDMTPPTPDVLTLTVQRVAPQLLSASVTSITLNSFSLVVSGYSTTRSLRQLDIQVTPKQGTSLSSTHLTIDLTSSSSAWFQSNASQNFGGTFSITIPFTLANGSSTADLVHLLQTLSVTANNDVGTSNSLSAPVQ